VRSVGDVHAIERDGLPLALGVRGGECRLAGLDAVKETILAVEHMKRVSMPSELVLGAGAGVDVDRMAGRAGSVNERRAVVEACGACSAVLEEAGTDMMKAFMQASSDRVEIAGRVWKEREGPCVSWAE
jgi:hypothetical protein